MTLTNSKKSNYRIYVHKSVVEHFRAFCVDHQEAGESFHAQFRQLAATPAGEGAVALKGVKLKELQGRVFRRRVKGRKGFRLIYLVESEKRRVFPIFITHVTRANYDWWSDDWSDDWLENAQAIQSDLVEGKTENFNEMLITSVTFCTSLL